MGTLRSVTDMSGMSVNGVTLGSPAQSDDDPPILSWDDSRLPNGEIVDGVLVVDESPLPG